MIAGGTPAGVTATHQATGVYASCDRHRHQHLNKEEAVKLLEKKLILKNI